MKMKVKINGDSKKAEERVEFLPLKIRRHASGHQKA